MISEELAVFKHFKYTTVCTACELLDEPVKKSLICSRTSLLLHPVVNLE